MAIKRFNGFSPGKFDHLPMPPGFFSELLPMVDDLAELKILLFCFWALTQKEGQFRYLRYNDFVTHEPLLHGLAIIDAYKEPEAILKEGLAKTVERGALLAVDVNLGLTTQTFYFPNTEQGRVGIDQLKAGHWFPGDDENPVEILPERPNIYRLYERNIGPLKPMVAEELKEMEAEFSTDWIEEAIRVAVEKNARNLRFIRAVLENRRDGRNKTSENDGTQYSTGKYADYFEN